MRFLQRPYSMPLAGITVLSIFLPTLLVSRTVKLLNQHSARNAVKHKLHGLSALQLPEISVPETTTIHRKQKFHKPEMSVPALIKQRNKSSTTCTHVLVVHFKGDADRAEALEKTWFRRSSDDQSMCLFRFQSISARSAFANTRDALSQAHAEYPASRWFHKFDDDAYVYTRQLVHMAETLNVTYGGYPITVASGFMFASGGAGYILSRHILETAVMKGCADTGKLSHPELEDVSIGECILKQAGITVTHVQGMHPHHPYQMVRWDKHGHPSDRPLGRTKLESYMNPISYHYMSPAEMVRMHDDIHLHGFPVDRRSKQVPRLVHQYWEGGSKPSMWLARCQAMYSTGGWVHQLWDRKMISQTFPSAENSVGMLQTDGINGQLINQDFFLAGGAAGQPHLMSDVFRYEALLLWGGVYLDADSECFRPLDALLAEGLKVSQGLVFLEKDVNWHGGLIANGVMAMHAFSPQAVCLVAGLLDSNWKEPPWISSGPMHLTKIVRRFQQADPGFTQKYLSINVMDSVYVYPFHHTASKSRNQQPGTTQDRVDLLVDRGACMDQMWGTTHASYGSDMHRKWDWASSSTLETAKMQLPPMGWASSYIQQHRAGISGLARTRPRWVVAAMHPSTGLCNRIMHVTSTLAFAIATGRTMLFDWVKVDSFTHENKVEVMGHSNFLDIFAAPAVDFSFQAAMHRFSDEVSSVQTRIIQGDNTEFLHNLRFGDLDSLYPDTLIRIERYDWWAKPLLEGGNPLYDQVLNNVSFSELFRFVFRPRAEDARLPLSPPCQWMVQRRSKWDRKTADLESFLKCAHLPQDSWEDRVVYVTTDSRETAAQVASKNSKSVRMISNHSNMGCRNSPKCDIESISAMYQLAQCKGAVLTDTSTFGACVAGLGEMASMRVVNAEGACSERIRDPVTEAGVLPHEIRQISAVMADSVEGNRKLSAAFIFLMYKPSDRGVQDLLRLLRSLHTHFNHAHHYPIIIFVESEAEDRWGFLQHLVSSRVHIVGITREEWHPKNVSHPAAAPPTFRLRSHPNHPGFNIDYRLMSRYSAGYLLGHPFLVSRGYDYVMKLDPDATVTATWTMNPFQQMHSKKKRLAVWVSYGDILDVTDGLWDAFVDYVRARRLNLQNPSIVMHETTGEYLRTNVYGCVVGADVGEFASERYADLFRWFDARNGFLLHRWDEQKIYAFYAALYFRPGDLELMQYIHVEHQQWATAHTPGLMLNLPAVPEELQRRVFGLQT